MSELVPISVRHLSHCFGEGPLRQKTLDDLSLEIGAGEIVLVTGPSGSGKTTLLTLVGALRAPQQGSVRVLGRELGQADPRTLEEVRRQVGYIFQAHNLLEALTARQNVMASVFLRGSVSRRLARVRAEEALAAVGLRVKLDHLPAQLSGGQRQRVAIARALAHEPRIVLADEPTASLDRQSGREVADLIRKLARERGVTVVVVTHDSRILDIADRILHLEDGRIHSLTEVVTSNMRLLMGVLADHKRRGEIDQRLAELSDFEFQHALEDLTLEAGRFLDALQLAESNAFESMLQEALRAFTFRLARRMQVERASLFLVDPRTEELWIQVAREEDARPVEARFPWTRGISGQVARTGRSVRVDDAYAHPLFNPEVDEKTGFRTRTILCVPIRDRDGEVFAVAQLLNRTDGAFFDDEDEARFGKFSAALGVVLESWWKMQRRRTA